MGSSFVRGANNLITYFLFKGLFWRSSVSSFFFANFQDKKMICGTLREYVGNHLYDYVKIYKRTENVVISLEIESH